MLVFKHKLNRELIRWRGNMETIDLLVFLEDADNGVLLTKGDDEGIIIASEDFFEYIKERNIEKMYYINKNETKIKLICKDSACSYLVEMV